MKPDVDVILSGIINHKILGGYGFKLTFHTEQDAKFWKTHISSYLKRKGLKVEKRSYND